MLNSQRGQTMPFWLVAIAVTLAMAFFVMSYVNTIAWQIHAQNAADSAAAAAVSVQANVLNEQSVVLYTAAVDEYRIRYLNQAMLNAINGVGCDPTPSGTTPPGNCRTIYLNLQPELNAAIDGYSEDVKLLQEANNFTQGGQQQAERKAIGSFGQFDPAFAYTPLCPNGNGNGNTPSCPTSSGNGKGHKQAATAVDLVACKNVPYVAPGLMFLTGTATQFSALGRAAAQAVPVNTSATPPTGSGAPAGYSEYFQPGLQTNPATGQPYQVPEDPAGTGNSPYFTVDYGSLNPGGGLTVDLNWYSSVAIKPYYTGGSGAGGGLGPGDYTCQ